MKTVIFGHTSYVGSRLAAAAASRGDVVVGLSSRECDLRDAEQALRYFESLRGEPFAAVLLAVVNKHVESSYDSYAANVAMVHNFIRGLRQAGGAVWTAYFSSVDVYGNLPPIPITESSPLAPDTWYGLAKLACEWMLLSSGEMPCPLAVLRIPGVYGPAANDRSVIGSMVRSARVNGEVRVYGSGMELRDYIHVEDTARLVLRLMDRRAQGVFNVASGQSRSVRDIAELVADTFGVPAVQREPIDPDRGFDLVFDTACLAQAAPGFTFRDIASGVQSYRDADAAGRRGREEPAGINR